MYGDFMEEDLNKTFKEKDGNVYKGLMDIILNSGTGDGIKSIFKKIPKFNVKRMELDEIETVLKKITQSVVNKLYQTDCGEYSLRQILREGELSVTSQTIATNNIAYGVISSASPYLLASLFYFFDESFIYFYVRDSIVEPNYREMIETIRKVYERPTEENLLIEKNREFSSVLNTILQNMLVDGSEKSTPHLTKNIERIGELVKEIPQHIVKDTMDTDARYPIPAFLYEGIMGKEDSFRDGMVDFITKLKKTFTKDGLRKLYSMYGRIETYGKNFDTRLDKLFDDRKMYNNLTHIIDGLEIQDLRVLHKILTFQSLSEHEVNKVSNNKILSKVQVCFKGVSSIGTSCYIDNEKLIIKTVEEENEFFYHADSLEKDKLSPFNIFGADRDMMERIYNTEPEKFCANQTVITTKDRQNMVIEGKRTMFKDTRGKINHRQNRYAQLINSNAIRNNKELLTEINNLKNGVFTKIKYVRANWFEPPVINDPAQALLAIAEMEGINLKIKAYTPSQARK
ncbi:MAG: hypothetical protein ACRCX8_12700 [Sarcina sp.]